jgi:AcrR family transcriptional regulator
MPEAATSKPRTQSAEVRREQILDAAATVLVTKGLADTTMADVARVAGVAKGTVYLYFDSKTQLLIGLQARYNQDLVTRTARLVGGEGERLRRLDRFLKELVEYHACQFELHRVLFHDASFNEEEATRPLTELFVRFVAEGVESGEFQVADPQATAAFLLAGLHAMLIPYLHMQPRTSRQRFLTTMGELCRRVLAVSV